MTNNVVDFPLKKKKKGDVEAPISHSQPVKLRTNNEIYQDVFDETVDEWQVYASKNRLNEYFYSKLPAIAKLDSATNYINDLNNLSAVEQKLDMNVVVLSPGATQSNPLGWMVSFRLGRNVYSTSPDLASESAARALAILLFLKFNRTMETLGRSLT